jgi:hypothetical protein
MKGIVFTEFLDMVESAYGYEMVDALIEENELESEGIYTAIGTYDHSEMVKLLVALGHKTQTSIPVLLKSFGHYLFNTFKTSYPSFFENANSAFDFLESIEEHIHVEVRKLYPDAELPQFNTKKIDDKTLEMEYHSERRMADFAEGLIEKSLEHYQEEASIERKNLLEDGSKVLFLIRKI